MRPLVYPPPGCHTPPAGHHPSKDQSQPPPHELCYPHGKCHPHWHATPSSLYCMAMVTAKYLGLWGLISSSSGIKCTVKEEKNKSKFLKEKMFLQVVCQSFPCVQASSVNHAIQCLTLGVLVLPSLCGFCFDQNSFKFEVTTNKPVRPAWYLSLWQLPHRACNPVDCAKM